MAARDTFVMGASAGGVEALRAIVQEIPAGFPGSICIVLHLSPRGPSYLKEILGRVSRLPVDNPVDRERIQKGHIYVAPPDHHLRIVGDELRLSKGPKVNLFRPAIDALFISAAESHGSRVAGVLLSGAGDDGTAGLFRIKRVGGVVLVQDPEDAVVAEMPRNALLYLQADHVAKIAEMAPILIHLASEPAGTREPDAAPADAALKEALTGLRKD